MEINDKKIVSRLLFSYTDELGETVSLHKTYNEDCDDLGTVYWLLEEFKYFLKAATFPEELVNRIVFLEKDEKIVRIAFLKKAKRLLIRTEK